MSFQLKRKDLHRPTAAWYSEYLQSRKWIEFRASLQVLRGEACGRCKKNPGYSLHHKTYARLFNELPEDVEFLCKDCHYKAHKFDDIPYLNFIYEEDKFHVLDCLKYTQNAPKVHKPNKRKPKEQNVIQAEQRIPS